MLKVVCWPSSDVGEDPILWKYRKDSVEVIELPDKIEIKNDGVLIKEIQKGKNNLRVMVNIPSLVFCWLVYNFFIKPANSNQGTDNQ